MSRNHQFSSSRGVSLVELLVTVVIMGVVAGIAVPIYLNNQQSAAEGQLKADIGQAADYITSHIEGGDTVNTDVLPGPFTDLAGLSSPLSIAVAENGRDFCIAGATRYDDVWYWSSTQAEFSQTPASGCPAPPATPPGD